MKKKVQLFLLVCALGMTMSACNKAAGTEEKKTDAVVSEMKSEAKEAEVKEKEEDGKSATSEETMEEKTEEKVFTLEELAKFNGKDGAKAYVAIDGVVYDVTDVKGWTGGEHKGFEAGQDLSEVIKKAPHGTSKLEGLPVVGKLKQ